MKTLLVMIALLASLPGAYGATQPDFTCLAENGDTYAFFSHFGEIHVHNRAGEEIGLYDSMTVSHVVLESYPPQHKISFIHEEGDTVAILVFRDNEKQGRGEMAGDRQTMTCVRN